MELFKTCLDKIRSILAHKMIIEPEITDLTTLSEQIDEYEREVKKAFNEDIIGLDEYSIKLAEFKKQREELRGKEKHYADAIIKNEKGEVLLLLRSSSDKLFPSTWCLPGGHIEERESPEKAAIRETKEETGLDINTSSLVLKKQINSGYICYYLCTVSNLPLESSIILDNGEHINYCFADKEKLSELNLILDLEETLLSLDVVIDNNLNLFPGYTSLGEGGLNGYSNVIEALANESGKDIFMLNLFSKGEINEEEYVDYIQKAHTDKAHPQKLTKLEGKDKKNKPQTKWVTKTELRLLAKHAKNSTHKDLEAVIKEHPNSTIREHAHKEIDRRGKEEQVQDKEKTGYEAHEYHGKEFKYDSKTESHLDPEGTKANPTKLYEYYDQRHKEQTTQLNAIKGDLETSTKDKQALNNKLVKTYYDKIKKTRFVGDEKESYDVAMLKLEKVGLQKEDIDSEKIKKIISKKLSKKK